MTNSVITELNQVSTTWLTDVLRASGALTAGTVTSFEVLTGGGNWSSNARLTLDYSADAAGDRPTQLFLKLVDTDTGDGEYFLPAEVTYYMRDYRDVPDAPLIRCYDARFAPDLQRYHVLLDDVSATHGDARNRAPSRDSALALAEGLAAMHARWWGAAGLAAYPDAALPDAAKIRGFIAIAEPGVPVVFDHLAAHLQPHWPEMIRAIFDRLGDVLIARTADADGFALVHGDVNPGNIMLPLRGDRPVYVIDCQPFDWSLTTWLGAYDLAYPFALYWDSDVRRALERPVLQQYHAHLLRHGVQNYTWQRLFDDYRLSVALCVPVAVEYLRGGPDRPWIDFIIGILRNSLTACDDLDCAALWR